MDNYNPYQRYATKTIINANAPVGDALNKAFTSYRVKSQKMKLKTPLMVNRPHTFAHPPHTIVIKPAV